MWPFMEKPRPRYIKRTVEGVDYIIDRWAVRNQPWYKKHDDGLVITGVILTGLGLLVAWYLGYVLKAVAWASPWADRLAHYINGLLSHWK